jgi:transposase
MEIPANDLPDTLDAAHALLRAERAQRAAADARHLDAQQLLDAKHRELERMQAERRELEAELAEIQARNARYEQIIAQLKRLQFGRSSERLDHDQLNLAFEDLAQGLAEIEQAEERADPVLKALRGRERREKRPSLPDHLKEVEVVLEPDQSVCPCCSGALHLIGEDLSRRLDVVPAQYQVIVTRRPKYACRACEGTIVQAPAPSRLIEGGLPTERLVAQVIVDKYADHVPLYRQSQAFARQGITLNRSTLAHWTGYAAGELKPVWEHIRSGLLAAPRLFVDETRAPVLDPGRGKTKSGYFWAVAQDQSGWAGTEHRAVAYTYTPGRGADHATALLKGFAGVLQTDGYAVYKTLAAHRNDVVLAHCWAHSRRKFYDLAQSGNAPAAEHVLGLIAKLYGIEREIRGQPPDTRRKERRQRSRPVLDELYGFLEGHLRKVPGSSVIADAIRYVLTRWDGLVMFVEDGHIELDTNAVERSMRPIALNRKNALFAGSDDGAKHWAILATLIECCKLNDVNPAAYLEDVITRLVNGHLNSRIDELTPWKWKAMNQAEGV